MIEGLGLGVENYKTLVKAVVYMGLSDNISLLTLELIEAAKTSKKNDIISLVSPTLLTYVKKFENYL